MRRAKFSVFICEIGVRFTRISTSHIGHVITCLSTLNCTVTVLLALVDHWLNHVDTVIRPRGKWTVKITLTVERTCTYGLEKQSEHMTAKLFYFFTIIYSTYIHKNDGIIIWLSHSLHTNSTNVALQVSKIKVKELTMRHCMDVYWLKKEFNLGSE